MKRFLVLLVWALALMTHAQNAMDGTILRYGTSKVFLRSIYGEKTPIIDSTVTDTAGNFRFSLSGHLPGTYRVQWTKDGFVDLIWNMEDVKFVTSMKNPDDSLQVISSLENRINRAYAKLDRTSQEKLQLLSPLIDLYPVKDAFYFSAVKEMERTQHLQQQYLDSLVALYPRSFAVRVAKVYQNPFIPASLGKEERMTFLKQHYFDKVDFSDTSLLRSMVFVNKAISYLSLYSNNRLQQKQLEGEFIKAVTVMLGAASVNPEVFKFWLDYLVGGFDKYHFDEVITYIADNFQDPYSCEDQPRKSALQKKLETFKKISIGKTAPEISVPDNNGKPVKMTGINSEYTLVVFWSSECPHCTAMMPKLKEYYEKQKPKRFEVLSVSIDTSRVAWTRFLREQKLPWINVSDLKGFNGKPADDFNIYATPTMFLLDRQKKIVAKPNTLREMESTLREFKLIQ
ncbi:MAG: thioredoxin-like domain-containing protein [Bacteroidota bacterium]